MIIMQFILRKTAGEECELKLITHLQDTGSLQLYSTLRDLRAATHFRATHALVASSVTEP
jgi:hypothetical protein